MIVPDLNLLLYAYDSKSQFNRKAVEWWQNCLSGTDPVGLPHVVIFGFIRLTTSTSVFQQPMTTAEAAGHVRSWLAQPFVQVLEPGTDHVEQTMGLLEDIGAAGNLVTDAQLAAATIEHAAILYTADADFTRFPELQWRNPISGQGSHITGKPLRRRKRE